MSKTTQDEDNSHNRASDDNRRGLGDYVKLAFLPLLFAVLAVILTWVVWLLTREPCTSELAKTIGCSLSSWSRYISLDLLNKMFTHGAIAGGAGGIWRYAMLRALERQLKEERRRAEEERQRADEERRKADEERRKADEERQKRIEAEELVAELRRNGNGNRASSESA